MDDLARIEARAASAGAVLAAWRPASRRTRARALDLTRLDEVCASAADVPVLLAAHAKAQAAKAATHAAASALVDVARGLCRSFPLAWCVSHATEDHMVDLDDKDEVSIAESVRDLHTALAMWDALTAP